MILILCSEFAIVDYPYSSLGPALQALALILLFALLDNDGTLWCEQPMYVQLAIALDRVK
jgi:hypothetical protein